MTQTLAQLSPGESGRVAALDFPSKKARRMEDLGFLPGQRVTALHTAPFGGITAYQVLDRSAGHRRPPHHITVKR